MIASLSEYDTEYDNDGGDASYVDATDDELCACYDAAERK